MYIRSVPIVTMLCKDSIPTLLHIIRSYYGKGNVIHVILSEGVLEVPPFSLGKHHQNTNKHPSSFIFNDFLHIKGLRLLYTTTS